MTFLVSALLSAGIIPAVAPAPRAACHQLDSESVLARDIAGWVPGFAKVPGDFLVGYIDSTGTPRVFHGADLEHIARNRGVELQGLEDLCLARRTLVVQPDAIAEAMRKTLGNPDPSANLKIDILSSSTQPVPSGEVVFPRSGVPPVSGLELNWRGFVQSTKGSTYPVWARARVTITTTRVVAATNLPTGKPIQAAQVRVESREVSPFEEGFAVSAAEVAGLVPKQQIPSGSAIRKTQVETPVDVARGDTVRVDVYAGSAHLRLEARAETAGVKGSTITVRNLGTNRDFDATVVGKDLVTVGGIGQ